MAYLCHRDTNALFVSHFLRPTSCSLNSSGALFASVVEAHRSRKMIDVLRGPNMTKILKKEPKMARTNDAPLERYLSVKGAAAYVCQSEAAIRLHLTLGKIKRYKYQGRTLIRASELASLIHEA
jgi:hypothetical protein